MVKHSLALLLLSVVLYCADGLSVVPSQTFSTSRISSPANAYRPKVSFTQQCRGRSSSATKIYSAAIAADASDTNIKYGPGKCII